MKIMIIKFDSAALPSAAIITQFSLQNVQVAPPNIMGWVGKNDDNSDVLLSNGDYLISLSATEFHIIRRVDYLASAQLQRTIVEEITIQLLEDIVDAFNSITPDSNKLSVLNTVGATMNAIVANKLNFAKAVYVATATTAVFTAGVKAAGLTLIDAAIAKL